MKKTLSLFILFFGYLFVTAQPSSSVTWMGVDFTHVNLIGRADKIFSSSENDPKEFSKKCFEAWNMLFTNETKNYNLERAFRKKIVFDIDTIMKKNAAIDVTLQESSYVSHVSLEEIQKFISVFNFSDTQGTAAFLIVYAMDKRHKKAYFRFVAFDKSSKQVVANQRFVTKPRGLGVQGYWADAIHTILNKIKRKKYTL